MFPWLSFERLSLNVKLQNWMSFLRFPEPIQTASLSDHISQVLSFSSVIKHPAAWYDIAFLLREKKKQTNKKEGCLWDVEPCGFIINWRFGGMYGLHLQDRRNSASEERCQTVMDWLWFGGTESWPLGWSFHSLPPPSLQGYNQCFQCLKLLVNI
jgi:hypothetical protein